MIKSNQITFIVTSPQHKCLGEGNSYERAPDSAKKKTRKKKTTPTIYIWTVHIYRLYRRQCAKYTLIYSVHTVYYKDIFSYQYTNTPYVHVCIMSTSMHSNMQRRSNGAGKAGNCLGPRILRGPPTADHLNNRKYHY